MRTNTTATDAPTAPTARPIAIGEHEAAAYIGFSVHFLRSARRHGGGPPFIRIRRAIRYFPADLDAFLLENRHVSRPKADEPRTAA
jgi:hypothetical protein